MHFSRFLLQNNLGDNFSSKFRRLGFGSRGQRLPIPGLKATDKDSAHLGSSFEPPPPVSGFGQFSPPLITTGPHLGAGKLRYQLGRVSERAAARSHPSLSSQGWEVLSLGSLSGASVLRLPCPRRAAEREERPLLSLWPELEAAASILHFLVVSDFPSPQARPLGPQPPFSPASRAWEATGCHTREKPCWDLLAGEDGSCDG